MLKLTDFAYVVYARHIRDDIDYPVAMFLNYDDLQSFLDSQAQNGDWEYRFETN